MIDTVKKLCSLFGPSGCEDEVRDYIRAQAEPYADEILQDANGSLLVLRRGKKTLRQTVMLAAHMDEVGVIVKSITDDGFLRFAFVGGVDRRVALGKKVYLGERRIRRRGSLNDQRNVRPQPEACAESAPAAHLLLHRKGKPGVKGQLPL